MVDSKPLEIPSNRSPGSELGAGFGVSEMLEIDRPYVFAGPSLYPSRDYRERWNVEILRPAIRGSVSELVQSVESAGILIIADGIFQPGYSVGRAEILQALKKDWIVYGVSSTGALRAAELKNRGMIGQGRVFALCSEDEKFDADEVALLHSPRYPYYPGSEPMVHIREYLKALKRAGTITEETCRSLQSRIKNLWFGDRTLEFVAKLLSEYVKTDISEVEHMMPKFRIKHFDLMACLERWKQE